MVKKLLMHWICDAFGQNSRRVRLLERLSTWSSGLARIRTNLLHRHIIPSALCLICNQEDEDVSHALWGCPYARDVWSMASPCLQKATCSMDDFRKIAQYIFGRLMPNERTQWMSITWALWSARNKLLFEEVLIPPGKVVEIGNNLWEDFAKAMSRGMLHSPPP